MRKLFDFSSSFLPSTSANSVQVVKTASALGNLFDEVILFGRRSNESGISEDIYTFYNVSKNIRVIFTGIKKNIPGITLLLRALVNVKIFSRLYCEGDAVYGRDRYTILLVSLLWPSVKTIYETHTSPQTFLQRFVDLKIIRSRNSLIITTSNEVREAYLRMIDESLSAKFHVVKNGSSDFKVEPKSIRKSSRVGYVGGVSKEKGLFLIFEMAEMLPDIEFVLIGKKSQDVCNISVPKNVQLRGHLKQSELIKQYESFSVLIAPYPADLSKENVNKFPSPLKISEYFSTGLPVVATNNSATSCLIEHYKTGILVSNEKRLWVDAINELFENAALSEAIGLNARQKYSNEMSWDVRAREIYKILESS